MLEKIQKMNLRDKFLSWLTVIVILFSLILSLSYYYNLRKSVVEDALDKSEIILREVEAIREYVKDILRPEMYKLHSDDIFVIEAMSTTYISLAIMERFGEKMPGYIYRRSSLNPHNRSNLADEFEESMFDWFEEDRERKFWQGVVKKGNESYFVSMIPDFFDTECIKCHGNWEDAPRSLVERYGKDGGFRFSPGDIAAINSVAIPVSKPIARIKKSSMVVFLATFVMCVLLLFIVNSLFERLVMSRLSYIMKLVRRGAGHNSKIINGHDELDTLKLSFSVLNRYVQTAYKVSRLEPGFIGKYVLEKYITAGAMSWLYAGMDTKTGEKVTIKLGFDNALINPLYNACLKSEIHIFSTMRHSNLLKVINNEEDALICESLEGVTFDEILRGEKITTEEWFPLMRQIFDIVSVLHSAGIVHHDLRPSNFVVTETGIVKLVDFGLASWRGIPDAIYESGVIPQGDLRYMAPEQRKGKRGDPRSDIYTLGIVMYEIITRRHPYIIETSGAKKWLNIKEEFDPPSKYAQNISDETEKVILTAMAWKVEDRYQWVEDFQDDLESSVRINH